MSNTPKSALQRIVGAVFLLALIALVAVLLMQPSEKIPHQSAQTAQPQKPTISVTANGTNKDNSGLAHSSNQPLILESATGKTETTTPPTEVIGENIWQHVEQKSHESAPTEQPIILASVDTHANTSNQRPATHSNNNPNSQTQASTKPQSAPKPTQKPAAEKPKVTAPKLELIADSEKTSTKPAQAPKPTSNGKWYVQMGAFGNSANAQKLVNQYKQQGYNVRIKKDNNLHRVQIGPYATKNEAEQVKSRTKSGSINPAVIQLP